MKKLVSALILIASINIACGFPIKFCNANKGYFAERLTFEIGYENNDAESVDLRGGECRTFYANDLHHPDERIYKVEVSSLCTGIYSCTVLEDTSGPIFINPQHDLIINGRSDSQAVEVNVIKDVVPICIIKR